MDTSKPGSSYVSSSSSKNSTLPQKFGIPKIACKKTLLTNKVFAVRVAQQAGKCHNNPGDCNNAKAVPGQPNFKEMSKAKKRNGPSPYHRELTSQVVDRLQTGLKDEVKKHSHGLVNSMAGEMSSMYTDDVMKSLHSLPQSPNHDFVEAEAGSRIEASTCHGNPSRSPCLDNPSAPIIKLPSPISNSSLQSVTKSTANCTISRPNFSLPKPSLQEHMTVSPKCHPKTCVYSPTKTPCQLPKTVNGSSVTSSLPRTSRKTSSGNVSSLETRLKGIAPTSTHSTLSGQFSEIRKHLLFATSCSLNMKRISLSKHNAKSLLSSTPGSPMSPSLNMSQMASKSPNFGNATTHPTKPSVKSSSKTVLSSPILKTAHKSISKHAVTTLLKHVPSLPMLQAASSASEHSRKSLPSTPTKEVTLIFPSKSSGKNLPSAMPSQRIASPEVCKDVHVSFSSKSKKPSTLCLKKSPLSPKFTFKESIGVQANANATPGLVISSESEIEGTSSMACSSANLFKHDSEPLNVLPSSYLAKSSSDAAKWLETKTRLNHKLKKMHVQRKSCKVVDKDLIVIDEVLYKHHKRHSTSDVSKNFLPRSKKPCFIDLTNPRNVTIDLTCVDDSPEPGMKEMKKITPTSTPLCYHDPDLTPELISSCRNADDFCTSTETHSLSCKSSSVRKLFCGPTFDLSSQMTATSDKKSTKEAEMPPFDDVPLVKNDQSAEETGFNCESVSSLFDAKNVKVSPCENISEGSFQSLLGPSEGETVLDLPGNEMPPNAMIPNAVPVGKNKANVNEALKDFYLDLNTESDDDDSVFHPSQASNRISETSSFVSHVLDHAVLVDCARNSTELGKSQSSEVARALLGGVANEALLGGVAESHSGLRLSQSSEVPEASLEGIANETVVGCMTECCLRPGKLQSSEVTRASLGDVANETVLGCAAKRCTGLGEPQSSEVVQASLGGVAKKAVVGGAAFSREGLVNVQEEVMAAVKPVLISPCNGSHSMSGDTLKHKQTSSPGVLTPGGIMGWTKTPLLEVRSLCADRRIFIELVVEDEMQLFSSTQDSILMSRLEQDTVLPSQRLCFMVEYLRMFTTHTKIPRAEILAGLWELLWKPLLSDSLRLLPEVVNLCMLYFRDLLFMHPPGQHVLVDEQYLQFVKQLTAAQSGSFGLWDHMECLIKSPATHQMASFLIDLLATNLWACLASPDRSSAPLFLGMFWTGTAGNLTLPIRRLIEDVVQLMQAWTQSMQQVCRLRNLMTLLYLAGTVCSDLSTELVLRWNKLSRQAQSYLIGHVYSASLQSKLIDNLPEVKKMHNLYRSIFDSETGMFAKSVGSVCLVPSLNPEPSHGNCNRVLATDTINPPATRHFKVTNPVRSNSTDISCSINRTKTNPSAIGRAKVANSVRSNSTDNSYSVNRTKTNPSAKVANSVRSNSTDNSYSVNRTKTNPSAKVANSVRSNSTDNSYSVNRTKTNPSATVRAKVANSVWSNSTDNSYSVNRTKTNPSATVRAKVANSVRSNSTDNSYSVNRTKTNPSATVRAKVANSVRSNSTDNSYSINRTKTKPSAIVRAKVANLVRSNSVDFSCSTALTVTSQKDALRRDQSNISCKPQSIDKCLKKKLKESEVQPRRASQSIDKCLKKKLKESEVQPRRASQSIDKPCLNKKLKESEVQPKRASQSIDKPCLNKKLKESEVQPRRASQSIDKPCLNKKLKESEVQPRRASQSIDKPCLNKKLKESEVQPRRASQSIDKPCLNKKLKESEVQPRRASQSIDKPCLNKKLKESEVQPRRASQSIDKPCLNKKLKESEVQPRRGSLDTSVETPYSTIPTHSQPASRGEKLHKSDSFCESQPPIKTRGKNEVPQFGLPSLNLGLNPTLPPGSSTHSFNKSVGHYRKNSSSNNIFHQSLLVYPNCLTGKKRPFSTSDPLHQAHPHKKHKHGIPTCTGPSLHHKSQFSNHKDKGKLVTTPGITVLSSTAPPCMNHSRPMKNACKYSSRPPSGQAKGQRSFDIGLGNSKKPPPAANKKGTNGVLLKVLQSVATVNGSKVGTSRIG